MKKNIRQKNNIDIEKDINSFKRDFKRKIKTLDLSNKKEVQEIIDALGEKNISKIKSTIGKLKSEKDKILGLLKKGNLKQRYQAITAAIKNKKNNERNKKTISEKTNSGKKLIAELKNRDSEFFLRSEAHSIIESLTEKNISSLKSTIGKLNPEKDKFSILGLLESDNDLTRKYNSIIGQINDKKNSIRTKKVVKKEIDDFKKTFLGKIEEFKKSTNGGTTPESYINDSFKEEFKQLKKITRMGPKTFAISNAKSIAQLYQSVLNESSGKLSDDGINKITKKNFYFFRGAKKNISIADKFAFVSGVFITNIVNPLTVKENASIASMQTDNRNNVLKVRKEQLIKEMGVTIVSRLSKDLSKMTKPLNENNSGESFYEFQIAISSLLNGEGQGTCGPISKSCAILIKSFLTHAIKMLRNSKLSTGDLREKLPLLKYMSDDNLKKLRAKTSIEELEEYASNIWTHKEDKRTDHNQLSCFSKKKGFTCDAWGTTVIPDLKKNEENTLTRSQGGVIPINPSDKQNELSKAFSKALARAKTSLVFTPTEYKELYMGKPNGALRSRINNCNHLIQEEKDVLLSGNNKTITYEQANTWAYGLSGQQYSELLDWSQVEKELNNNEIKHLTEVTGDLNNLGLNKSEVEAIDQASSVHRGGIMANINEMIVRSRRGERNQQMERVLKENLKRKGLKPNELTEDRIWSHKPMGDDFSSGSMGNTEWASLHLKNGLNYEPEIKETLKTLVSGFQYADSLRHLFSNHTYSNGRKHETLIETLYQNTLRANVQSIKDIIKISIKTRFPDVSFIKFTEYSDRSSTSEEPEKFSIEVHYKHPDNGTIKVRSWKIDLNSEFKRGIEQMLSANYQAFMAYRVRLNKKNIAAVTIEDEKMQSTLSSTSNDNCSLPGRMGGGICGLDDGNSSKKLKDKDGWNEEDELNEITKEFIPVLDRIDSIINEIDKLAYNNSPNGSEYSYSSSWRNPGLFGQINPSPDEKQLNRANRSPGQLSLFNDVQQETPPLIEVHFDKQRADEATQQEEITATVVV